MLKVSPFYFPCLHSHSSPDSGSFEGNVIAVIFRCLPFLHGLCPRTWRFPGTWQVRDLPLALDTSQWWSVEGLQLSASRPHHGGWKSLAQVWPPCGHPTQLSSRVFCTALGNRAVQGPPFSFPGPGAGGLEGRVSFSHPLTRFLPLPSQKLSRIFSLGLDVEDTLLLPSSGVKYKELQTLPPVLNELERKLLGGQS